MENEPFIIHHSPPSSSHLPLAYGEVAEYGSRASVSLWQILAVAVPWALLGALIWRHLH
jgi:hypothetical protein